MYEREIIATFENKKDMIKYIAEHKIKLYWVLFGIKIKKV